MLVLLAVPAHADPGSACAALCRKLQGCKLATFKPCVEVCQKQGADRTPKGRAETFAQARSSCPQLAAQMRPSQWVCSAEGESVSASDWGNGPRMEGPVNILGSGKTKAQAAFNALRDCRAIVTFDLGLAQAGGIDNNTETAITHECRVTQCYPPGR